LLVPARTNGRRVYTAKALSQLAVVLHARSIGFSIAETRSLVSMFPPASPSARWKTLAAARIVAIDEMIAHAQSMKTMLQLISGCRCETWDQCGNALIAKLPARTASAR
jgi:DNA-binding transcriptional MerR regulator